MKNKRLWQPIRAHKVLLLWASFLAWPALAAQSFIIINPYNGPDGKGPYPKWYGKLIKVINFPVGVLRQPLPFRM